MYIITRDQVKLYLGLTGNEDYNDQIDAYLPIIDSKINKDYSKIVIDLGLKDKKFLIPNSIFAVSISDSESVETSTSLSNSSEINKLIKL